MNKPLLTLSVAIGVAVAGIAQAAVIIPVNFDGANLVRLTDGDGTHTIQYSPSRKYVVDTFSQVNVPPVVALRSSEFGKPICPLEQADVYELQGRGWTPPRSGQN